MLLPSPVLNDSALPTVSIEVEHEPFDSDSIVSVEVWSRVNRVPRARLVINDGNPATESFPLSKVDTFLPGKHISIAAGYGHSSSTIFSGVIVKHALDIGPNRPARLVIDMADIALKMTLQRRNAVFKDSSDHTVIAGLVSTNGLTVTRNDAPSTASTVVQYHATDWDLLVMRAEANGLVVIIEDGRISVVTPDTSAQAALIVEYGDSLLAFEATLDATTQLRTAATKSRSWDYTTQKVQEGVATDTSVTTPGDVTTTTLAAVFNLAEAPLQSAAMLPKDALDSWSSAELLRSRLGKVCGHVRFQGSSLAKVGKMIELAGVGPRFTGNAYISSVDHMISDNRWLTSVDFGLPTARFADETPLIADTSAGGQLPPVRGLQTGIVKQVDEDPDGDYRVLVSLPLLGSDAAGVWARLGGFYASKAFGAVFYPELGDEVILGFMSEDPRSPVILGSVYSKDRAPAYPPNKENDKKAIVTRSKLEITFDDKDKVIEIKTPGGHSIKLDDNSGEIDIKDSNSNSVVLGKNGITIDSASNITMSAKADIAIKAGGNLAMQATAESTLKAMNITEQANMKHAVVANATAELKASAMVTINGALVKIN
ncbi:type VI secretion system tip protein VgrG [Bradyrhizobium sp. 2TAF24]|uniref:type VI secretion system tip protein VgrG n=1 Tax=Bradyrhizobium sp. 2TAF24 TaxID=3233011 RepID=UPI003F92C20D